MMDTQRNARPIRHEEVTTHHFTTGQLVRFRGEVQPRPQSANTYRITGTLPPRGDSPQYRIRNDEESYERVATQDSLEPVRISPGSPSALVQGTFGVGQVTETQRSQDQKAEVGEDQDRARTRKNLDEGRQG
jgi:hypothetical protein